MFCKYCGRKIKETDTKCPYCGGKRAPMQAAIEIKELLGEKNLLCLKNRDGNNRSTVTFQTGKMWK
ncbi:MAG: zinc-ribbon domain-containing protein [Lachnospiraceae bacterium]|nr:zinc-ribbon domain-containing protein [Lachnospiraceae bacterium]